MGYFVMGLWAVLLRVRRSELCAVALVLVWRVKRSRFVFGHISVLTESMAESPGTVELAK